MSEQSKRKVPYKSLGDKLKGFRQKLQENMAEVSGAVEIDIDTLSLYEQGIERPSEEILLLLISHFEAKEEEAAKLWELAGYAHRSHGATIDAMPHQQNVAVLPMDIRISYTDMVHASVNDYGVILNFMQSVGLNNQPLAVSRVGMSKEHAKHLIELLQKTLEAAEPKALPAPESFDEPQE